MFWCPLDWTSQAGLSPRGKYVCLKDGPHLWEPPQAPCCLIKMSHWLISTLRISSSRKKILYRFSTPFPRLHSSPSHFRRCRGSPARNFHSTLKSSTGPPMSLDVTSEGREKLPTELLSRAFPKGVFFSRSLISKSKGGKTKQQCTL